MQVRFEGETGRNTRATATAVRVGSHVIEVIYHQVKADTTGRAIPVRIDGRATTIDDRGRHLGDARVVAMREDHKASVYVESPSDWFVAIENLSASQNIIVQPPSRKAKGVRGIAGTPNGRPGDDLRRRDGTVLPQRTLRTVAGLYGDFARQWRVRPGERLFTDTPAARWRTRAMTALPKVVLSLGDLPAGKVAEARQKCLDAGVPAGADLEDCTFDVAVSGDDAWALQQAASDTTPKPDNDGERTGADHPLLVAADRCDDDALARTLSGGAAVSLRRAEDNWTALMFAAQHDCPETVRRLLAAGADIRATSTDGFFALYLAAQNGHLDVVRRLLRAGADPDQALPSGDAPLLIATLRGHDAVVTELLRAGADPNFARDDGVTPLHAAAQEGALSALRALLAAGADVERATFEAHTTALQMSASGDPDIVTRLLQAGAKPNRPDAQGNTALHYAASDGADAVVRILLRAGGNPRARNERGQTPRDVADHLVEHLFEP